MKRQQTAESSGPRTKSNGTTSRLTWLRVAWWALVAIVIALAVLGVLVPSFGQLRVWLFLAVAALAVSGYLLRYPTSSSDKVRLRFCTSFERAMTACRGAAAELDWVVVEMSDSGFVSEEPFSMLRSWPARIMVTIAIEGEYTIVTVSGSTVGSGASGYVGRRVAKYADLLRSSLPEARD